MALRYYHLWSIGCQMNQADAHRVSEELEVRGYLPVQQPWHADIIVLNTCVVRQSAENKVLGRLTSLKSLARDGRERLLVVMGCFVDDAEALGSRYSHVDAFLAPSDIAGLVDFVERWDPGCVGHAPLGEYAPASHVVDLVPISYGCDHHCTYCIVRLRRGAERSRPIFEIAEEVRRLLKRGTREIVLLGQNVDSYGRDLPGRPDLANVLEAIHDFDDLWRIRFLTSHPKDMTQRIIDTVAALPKACECWDLPVQSGDNAVLRRMARGYTVERFCDLVQRIRQATPGCAVNTDVIVGFPGETREQFKSTLQLIREMRFDVVHVAAYSPRPGTPAAEWLDDVPREEKERRRALIEETQTEIANEINSALLGRKVEVLVDGRQRGRWRGRTRTNKLVFFESEEDWHGRMAQVRVIWAGPWSTIGEVVL